jgi:cytochrome c oxidase subunit 2
VRGVSEQGAVGPDLTHLASRRTLAAGTLEMSPAALKQWLLAPEATKPDAHMPGFAMLDDAELDAIVAFLMELK